MAQSTSIESTPSVTPAEAREIAKEAYVYGFPMVDNYRIQYDYFVDRDNPETSPLLSVAHYLKVSRDGWRWDFQEKAA